MHMNNIFIIRQVFAFDTNLFFNHYYTIHNYHTIIGTQFLMKPSKVIKTISNDKSDVKTIMNWQFQLNCRTVVFRCMLLQVFAMSLTGWDQLDNQYM